MEPFVNRNNKRRTICNSDVRLPGQVFFFSINCFFFHSIPKIYAFKYARKVFRNNHYLIFPHSVFSLIVFGLGYCGYSLSPEVGLCNKNMAVQSWIDILKSSKKAALIHDGEYNEEKIVLFKEKDTSEWVFFCQTLVIFISSDCLRAFQLTLILLVNEQVAWLAHTHVV